MKNGKAKYNWEELKNDFFNSNDIEASVFIRSKLGMTEQELISNGNIRKRITGWTKAKQEWTRNKNAEIQRQIRKDLIEKLKVPLEESLGIRSMLSQSDIQVLSIFLRIIDNKNPPTKKEIELFKAFPDKFADIWKRVQIELGSPTSTSELRGLEDLPITIKNLVINSENINRRKKEEEEKKKEEERKNKENKDVE